MHYLFLEEFVILKSFKVVGHSSKASNIKEVRWDLPLSGWVKCNTMVWRAAPSVLQLVEEEDGINYGWNVDSSVVPWWLRTLWLNISHIFREGNECVDPLTNFGVACIFSWWDTLLAFVRAL
ncbi:hypothetical protein HKD37_07G018416 [Glycine soja]